MNPSLSGDLAPSEIIRLLNMQPHPEGGHYVETFRDENGADGGSHSTAIYFLLEAGDVSHWHRVTNAAEVWHYYAGAPLVLSLSKTDAGPAEELVLGPDLVSGHKPQLIVPPHWWQAARSTGDWTLVGCTVSPGFQFEGFELATPGFDIPKT